MSKDYAFDVFMEPVFWIVDNYVHLLGPVRKSYNQDNFIEKLLYS